MASSIVGQDARTAHTADARLYVVARVCSDIAQGIHLARSALRTSPEHVDLVADALDRLGWMAERAASLSGKQGAGVVGDADSWMFGDVTQEAIATIPKTTQEGA